MRHYRFAWLIDSATRCGKEIVRKRQRLRRRRRVVMWFALHIEPHPFPSYVYRSCKHRTHAHSQYKLLGNAGAQINHLRTLLVREIRIKLVRLTSSKAKFLFLLLQVLLQTNTCAVHIFLNPPLSPPPGRQSRCLIKTRACGRRHSGKHLLCTRANNCATSATTTTTPRSP